MKTQGSQPRWLLLLGFSIAGYAAVFFLFPKATPAARWGQKLDHASAIAQAKQIARSLGVENIEGNGWIATARISYDAKTEAYLAEKQNGVGQGLFTPLRMSVAMVNPSANRKVKVELNSEGKLVLFEFSGPKSKADGNKTTDEEAEEDDKNGDDEKRSGIKISNRSQAGPTSSVTEPDKSADSANTVSEADKQLAESAFKSFWGEKLSSASLTESSLTKQGARLIWSVSDDVLKLTARALVSEGKVKALSLEREFTPPFNQAFEARRSKTEKILSGAEVVVIFPAVLLVAIFYFIGLALKRVQHRQGLLFLGAASLWVVTVSALTSLGDDIREDNSVSSYYWLSLILTWLLVVLLALSISGSLYFFWAAGQALAITRQRRQTISIELILKGKILTRPVARSVALGLLSGGLIAAMPVLATVTKLFPGIEVDPNGLQDHLIGRFPAFSTFTSAEQYLFFMIFGFFAPLISAFVKRPALEKLLIFLVCAAGWLGTIFVHYSAAGLLVSGLFAALISTTLYLRDGLLAALISQTAAQTAVGAAALLSQPSFPLHSSGWRAIASLAGLVIVSLVGVWKFREVTEEETAIPAHLLETRIERERLKAEFSVAQRAQQQMLPDALPQIPGLDIAAICKPSKEVGGDLYDFLSLSDGRLGIVVADVSGKGVPASLYMTLTKGLLISVSETASDPGEILREVNRHLYEVCRRRMFVTLFLGVIDPATKTLVYARAGHNPTVFRRVAQQKTSLLKPKGMGLGLNSGKIFNQSLQVATLQLEPNDKLFFYSDGITEAMNPKNEEYGEERLMEIAAMADGYGATEARDAVLADVTTFLGANQPQDDQTLVVVKVI